LEQRTGAHHIHHIASVPMLMGRFSLEVQQELILAGKKVIFVNDGEDRRTKGESNDLANAGRASSDLQRASLSCRCCPHSYSEKWSSDCYGFAAVDLCKPGLPTWLDPYIRRNPG
jgi:hypothetical protein